MKILIYDVYQSTKESGEVITIHKEIPWSEKNEENAKVEAYNGYTIEDDGQPEPVVPTDDEEVWDELALALKEGVDSI